MVGDLVRLTYARNSGIAFSLFAGRGLSAVDLLARRGGRGGGAVRAPAPGSPPGGSSSLALILGGAIGNLIDRVTTGQVVDFILLSWGRHEFPVFNVADIAVTCGVSLFALTWSRDDAASRRTPPRPARRLHRPQAASATRAPWAPRAHPTRSFRMTKTVDLTVPELGAGQRVDRWLAKARIGLSRNRLQALIEDGRVSVNGRRARQSLKLKEGDRVSVDVPPRRASRLVAEAMPLSIVHEDDALLVLDKPAGLVVHPGAGVQSGTLVHALLHHAPGIAGVGGEGRPGIVHRLDKDTSGLLVVAKTEEAYLALVEALRTRARLARLPGHRLGRSRARRGRDRPAPRPRPPRAHAHGRGARPAGQDRAHALARAGALRPRHAGRGEARNRPHAPDPGALCGP